MINFVTIYKDVVLKKKTTTTRCALSVASVVCSAYLSCAAHTDTKTDVCL